MSSSNGEEVFESGHRDITNQEQDDGSLDTARNEIRAVNIKRAGN
jgi:hypothetical protein